MANDDKAKKGRSEKAAGGAGEFAEKTKKEGSKTTFSIDKVKDFPDWYDRALEIGAVVDTRYPVKGMNVWMPYGYAALKAMMGTMQEIMDRTGHKETYFPMLIPESIFGKERDFLKGFKGEAFVVTKAGTSDLTEKLYIRPTSETVMYETVRLWIRSSADLPLKLYQIVNIFRHETKQTRPMLRLREVVKFKEAHTFHATAEEAEAQIREAIDAYKEFFDRMLIPYIIVKTPSWDTFAGAVYNMDFISVIPDGKAIELGSVINLGQKFAKAFDITYQTGENSREYVHQTCYGISERELGVLLAIHGDNDGLIMPPVIAPVHVVIVPIMKKGVEEELKRKAEELRKELSGKGFKVEVDTRDKGAGDKFYEWEAKGVPIRIEFGPKELGSGNLVLYRRDKQSKSTVGSSGLAEHINKTIDDITKTLRERADAYLRARILHFKTSAELKEKYTEREGLVGLPWCGDEKCGRKLEEEIGIPTVGFVPEKELSEACASCGKRGHTVEMFFGRTY